jgi:hypothetical protein
VVSRSGLDDIASSRRIAIPKSMILSRSPPRGSRSTTTFSGLKSRWIRLAHDRHHAGCGHRRGPLDQVVQRLAGRVLHHQVAQAAAGLADVDHADDVGVLQRAGELGLAQEPAADGVVPEQALAQDLDRERPADLDVARAVHRAHRAVADPGLDAIARGDHRTDQAVWIRLADHAAPACDGGGTYGVSLR